MSYNGSHYNNECVDSPEEINYCLEECRFPDCRNCIPSRRRLQAEAMGITRQSGRAIPLDANRLAMDWNAGLSAVAMAQNQGVSGPVISRLLSRLGLSPPRGARDKITVDFLLQSEQAYRFT